MSSINTKVDKQKRKEYAYPKLLLVFGHCGQHRLAGEVGRILFTGTSCPRVAVFPSASGGRFSRMFQLFQPKPINKQIAMYVAWKAVRHPLMAGTHQKVLQLFFTTTRIRQLGEVTPDCLRAYCNRFPAQYQRIQFENVMRQFCRYWMRMGELSHEFADFMKEDTIVDIIPDLSPTMHIDQVRRVRQLRREGLSLSQVKLKMETEDGRPYHLKQIHRWSKYLLPQEKMELSTGLVRGV